jgi:hypothetical protein
MFHSMSTNLHEKATLYLTDLWGYDRVEARNLTWRFENYAQFPNAVRVEYTIRGKRKRQTAMITTVPLIVLEGWDHPDPPLKLGSPEPTAGNLTVQSTRRLSCDPEWQNEFDAFLYGYLKGSKARVLLDLRKHDPTKIRQ